jgi:uncharacterized protein (TIGR02271 family)
MSDMTHDPARLNQGAAHDTGLYDPTVHDNQIVALYDTDAQARAAKDALVRAGFPAASMQVMARDEAATTAGVGGLGYEPTTSEGGLWSSVKNLFVPDEDRTTYNTAIARGHAMLVVTPGHDMDRQRLIHTLEATNPLDFDAKLEEWRQAGYDTTGYAAGTPTSNVATAGHAVDAGLNTANSPTANTYGTVRNTAGNAARASAGPATPETIKIMEERLRVGKREVANGAVRVRSYIVERPVEEQVRLREERVSIERRPVDRAATPADIAAFEERTIEARATSEEAVISKDARIIEEIAVNKQATERTETVRDSVRKTEVEVDGDAAGRTGSLPGNLGKNPNATPAAGTSGANSPKR